MKKVWNYISGEEFELHPFNVHAPETVRQHIKIWDEKEKKHLKKAVLVVSRTFNVLEKFANDGVVLYNSNRSPFPAIPISKDVLKYLYTDKKGEKHPKDKENYQKLVQFCKSGGMVPPEFQKPPSSEKPQKKDTPRKDQKKSKKS